MQGTTGIHARANAAHVAPTWGHQLDCLCPAKRSFWARLTGKPIVTKETVDFAEVVHAGLRNRRPVVDKALVENFCEKNFGTNSPDMLVSDPDRLFANATALAKANHKELGNVLAGYSRELFVAVLARHIGHSGNLGDRVAMQRAELVYTALVAEAARSANKQAASKVDELRQRLQAAQGSASGGTFDELNRIGAALADMKGDQLARIQLGRELAAARASWGAKGAAAEITGLAASVTLETPAGELQRRLDKLDQIEASLAGSKAMPDSSSAAIRTALGQARGVLETLRNRETDLAALHAEMAALQAKATPEAAKLLKLDEALGQVTDAGKYAARKQALDRVLSTIGGHDRGDVLAALSHAIRPTAKATDRDNTYLLDLIDQGDADIIDMVFDGVTWHDDAKALKLAALERGFDAQVAAVDNAGKSAAEVEALLRPIDAARQKALLSAEVQHSRRVVSTQLDAMFQQASASGKESPRGLFGMLRRNKERTDALPEHLFKATKPNVEMTAWLLNNAKPLVEKHNLLIADYIRLSYFDSATGSTSPEADALIAALFAPPADAAKNKTHKAEPGPDKAAVAAYIAQGFKNLEEVNACRDHLLRFAKAFAQTEQGQKVEEALFVHVKAQRVATHLVQKATGLHFASPDGDGVGPAMATWFERSAPWVSVQGRPGGSWEVSKRSVANRMAAQASAAARTLGKAAGLHDVEKAKTGNPWVDQALQEVRALRSACIDRLLNVEDSSPRAWITDRAKRKQARGIAERAREAVRLNEEVRRKDLSPGAILAADQARAQALASIQGLRMVSLRRDGAAGQALSADDLAGQAAYTDLADLELLDALDAQEEGLLKDPNEQARASEDLAVQALKIAILQEVAGKGPDATWTQLAERRQQVMDRLKIFGIDPSVPGEPMKHIQAYINKKFDQFAKNDLATLCTEWDPVTALHQARSDAAQVKAQVKARVTGAGQQDAINQAKRERAELLARRIGELRDGRCVTIRFGAYGAVNVGVPIPIPVVSVGKELRTESSNAITVALENGRYTLSIAEGESSRKAVTLSVLQDILSASAAKESGSESAGTFHFDSAADCIGLAAALANGDAGHPALWGIKVERSREDSSKTASQLGASASLGIAELGSWISGERGTKTSRVASGASQALTYERSYAYQAGAKAQLIADMGGDEVARGVDKAVRRTLALEFDVLLKSPPEVVVAHKVVGGDIQGALRRALPQGAHASIDALRAQMGDLGDGKGTEFFVRYSMTEDAQAQARQALAQVARLRAQASIALPAEARELLGRARTQLAEAHKILKTPANYAAAELGWTLRTEAAAITQERVAYTKFTSGEAAATRTLALDAPYPLEETSLP